MYARVSFVTLLMVRISLACLSVQVYSDILGSLQFDMLATVPEESSSNGRKGNLGRAYKSSGRPVYQSTIYTTSRLTQRREREGGW
jgi:hypothetical protein